MLYETKTSLEEKTDSATFHSSILESEQSFETQIHMFSCKWPGRFSLNWFFM